MNKDAKKRNLIQNGMYLLGITLIVGSLLYLGNVFLEYKKGEMEYDALHKQVFAQIEEDASEDAVSQETVVFTDNVSKETLLEQKRREELDKQVMQAISDLKNQNKDVIGWISFDNMELSYPIMQGEDNEYYLNHTFSGEINSSGSIFMEVANHSDFEDCHTIIYGHNMKNMSMFGRLKKYKTENYYNKHQYFSIYTESQVYRYQIFAYYDIPETDDVYTIGFQPNSGFKEFVDEMIKHSYHDTGVEVTEQDKVITLSTCSDEGMRFVVNAKRIESEYDE